MYERILDACEALIRRHGPAKATVVDVARALGMSHGNVYRHVPSKAALREAVVQRWLESIEGELAASVPATGSATDRIAAWVRSLARIKRARLQGDPELFAAYASLGDEQQRAVARHLAVAVSQLAAVIEDGIRTGEFAAVDPAETAQAVFDATSSFHNPHRVPETTADPASSRRLDAIIGLVTTGLRTRE